MLNLKLIVGRQDIATRWNVVIERASPGAPAIEAGNTLARTAAISCIPFQSLKKFSCYFVPIVDPIKLRDVQIVRRSVQVFFPIEAFKVIIQIIDHIISVNDGLASTENDLLPT
jgi:hypothetical protein